MRFKEAVLKLHITVMIKNINVLRLLLQMLKLVRNQMSFASEIVENSSKNVSQQKKGSADRLSHISCAKNHNVQ